ncbi:MAG: transposase [Cyanobacteriota bacterium]
MREYLKKLKESNLSPEFVAFDKWYNAYETLNLIEGFNWKYVTLSNGNRIFNSKVENPELDLKKTEKRRKRGKKKSNKNHVDDYNYFGAKSKFGKLNKVKHTVQIIKNGDRYVLTNILKPLNSVQAWKLYQKRWVLETIFRDLKSFLHLNQCSSRSIKAQKNHIICTLEAYTFLKKNYLNKSIEAAHQEFLQKVRKLKPKQTLVYLKAA